MLYYQRLFCQLKLRTPALFSGAISLFILAGCGQNKEEMDYVDRAGEIKWTTAVAPARWFKTSRRFALQNELSEPKSHPFYDLSPAIDYPRRLVSFYVTTPVGAPVSYELEMLSGRRYQEHRFCAQEDVWGSVAKKILLPNYTEGILPRVVDEAGRPMKIRVFGRELYYKEDYGDAAHRVKVVGGIMESVCEAPPCVTDDDWQSHLVVIAIDPADPKFEKVEDIADLKKVVDWNYAKAFMQTAHGSHRYMEKRMPAYRVAGEFAALLTLRMATTYGNLLSVSELSETRRACHKLYDYVWDQLGQDQFTVETVEIEEDIKNTSHLARVQSDKKKVLDETNSKKIKKYIPFGERWKKFAEKFGRHYLTCSDYVYPSNIADGAERHWFFTYQAAFFRLWRMGYRYDCTRQSWVELSQLGKKKKDSIYQSVQNCSERALDMAFVRAVDKFRELQKLGKTHWRYLEYDYEIDGAHEKIHSWARFSHRELFCQGPSAVKADAGLSDSMRLVFPMDVRWNFHHNPDSSEQMRVQIPVKR